MGVNLRGVLVVTQRVPPPMLRRRSGRIINNSSMAVKEGLPKLAHYCNARPSSASWGSPSRGPRKWRRTT